MTSSNAGPEATTKKKSRRARGRGLRTTTGCIVCRRRHLKCGEQKPECDNCIRSRRECKYEVPAVDAQLSSTLTQTPGVSDSHHEPDTTHRNDIQSSSDLPSSETMIQEESYNQTVTDTSFVYSPISTLSSTAGQGPEIGPLRWFGMVATDFQNNYQAPLDLLSPSERAIRNSIYSNTGPSPTHDFDHSTDTRTNALDVQNIVHPQPTLQSAIEELPPWCAEISPKDEEVPILQHFCNNIADWMDVLDPIKHFASMLPQLAMKNEGLLKAMLALSARHMSLCQSDSDTPMLNQTIAIQYYHETLQYLHNAMKHPEYLRSVEVNATSLILSTYEMIDGMGRGWIRHLKGVFWIQRSQDVNADSGGLKAAIWWAWLRQDTWAALRERRKVLTIYAPANRVHDLDFWHHANYISFLFARCVSYMADEDTHANGAQLQEKIDRADHLFAALDEWYALLPVNFKPIPCTLQQPRGGHSIIKPIWISPCSFGTVMQMYQASRAILLAHAPTIGGFREFSSRNKQLTESIDAVCGIAMSIEHSGPSIVSTSCLWAVGLCTQESIRRETIIDLLREHKSISSWPITDLGEDLKQEWAKLE